MFRIATPCRDLSMIRKERPSIGVLSTVKTCLKHLHKEDLKRESNVITSWFSLFDRISWRLSPSRILPAKAVAQLPLLPACEKDAWLTRLRSIRSSRFQSIHFITLKSPIQDLMLQSEQDYPTLESMFIELHRNCSLRAIFTTRKM